MFETLFRPKKAPADTLLVSQISARDHLSYAEVVERMQKRGQLLARDPRAHLNPVRVREFSRLPPEELIRRYGQTLERGMQSANSREARVRYAAALKLHRQKAGSGATLADLTKRQEKVALQLVLAAPGDKAAREALELSAGLNDNRQRAIATRGFEGKSPSIAKAAKTQGRSWLEVRDDLVKFGMLGPKDPRRKIRRSDIDFQKKGSISVRKTLSAEKLERAAMTRLRKDPKDVQALGWIATAGAMEGPKKARHVKGVLPPRRGFGRLDFGL